MVWLHDRSQRSTLWPAPVPHGHCKTTSFAAAFRTSGLTAPMVLDGPMMGLPSLPKSSRFWWQACYSNIRSH